MNEIVFAALHGLFGQNRLLNGAVLFFGDWLTYLLVAGLFIFILRLKGLRTKAFWTGNLLLAYLLSRWVITAWIQYLYPQPRPFIVLGFDPAFLPWTAASFPSAHMSSLFAVSTILFFANKRWGMVYLTLSFLVGLGRIALGLHWPTDILGGILIGCVSAWVLYRYVGRPNRPASLDINP